MSQQVQCGGEQDCRTGPVIGAQSGSWIGGTNELPVAPRFGADTDRYGIEVSRQHPPWCPDGTGQLDDQVTALATIG